MALSTKTMNEKDIDIHIGQRLKVQRLLLGMTLEQVGKLIDVSFQQVQKYETGKNSISANKIVQLANILGVDGNYFLEPLITTTSTSQKRSLILDANDKDLVELVRIYSLIENCDIKRQLINIASLLK